MRRTKATVVYHRTKNLPAVLLRPGHRKVWSTLRQPGVKVEDALEIAEQTEVQGATGRGGLGEPRRLAGPSRNSSGGIWERKTGHPRTLALPETPAGGTDGQVTAAATANEGR